MSDYEDSQKKIAQMNTRLYRQSGGNDPKVIAKLARIPDPKIEAIVEVLRDEDSSWEDFAKAFCAKYGEGDRDSMIYMVQEQP